MNAIERGINANRAQGGGLMGWWNPLPLLDLCCVRIFRNDHTFSRKPVMCIMGWGDAGDLQIWYPPPPPPHLCRSEGYPQRNKRMDAAFL